MGSIKQYFSELGFELRGLYRGPLQPVLVRCTTHGHEAERALEEVLGGQGCKYCALRDSRLLKRNEPPRKRAVRNLERRSDVALSMAKTHGFDIVGEYRDSRTRVLVRCSRGHESMKTTNDIQQGGGCRLCYAQKLLSSQPSSDSPTGTSSQ